MRMVRLRNCVENFNWKIPFQGHENAGVMWRSRYEDDDLIRKVDDLWEEVKPLYDELHKFVRYQLRDLYGNKIDTSSENIPAHLLGNMWVS